MIKLRFYDIWEKFALNFLGPFYRNIGKNFAQAGLGMQGDLTSDDRLVPSLRCRKFQKVLPQLSKADFVAPNSVVVGKVSVGEKSSLWYGATLRGDLADINIGNNTIIQDLVSIVPRDKSANVSIGDNVFVGPNSLLEACQLQDNAFVGMGSTIRQNSKVESHGFVAAGAVIPEGTTVPSNQIWAGNPARYLRDITPEEKQVVQEHQQEITQLARIHSEETEKSFRQVIDDLDQAETERHDDPEQTALKKIKELGFPMSFEEEDYIEQRVFMKDGGMPKESDFWKKNYDPYEQDLFNFPDSFKNYQENYDRYEEVKKFFEQNPKAEAVTPNRTVNPSKNDKSWSRKW